MFRLFGDTLFVPFDRFRRDSERSSGSFVFNTHMVISSFKSVGVEPTLDLTATTHGDKFSAPLLRTDGIDVWGKR